MVLFYRDLSFFITSKLFTRCVKRLFTKFNSNVFTLYSGAGKMVTTGGVADQPYVVSLLIVDTKLWTGLSNGYICIYDAV